MGEHIQKLCNKIIKARERERSTSPLRRRRTIRNATTAKEKPALPIISKRVVNVEQCAKKCVHLEEKLTETALDKIIHNLQHDAWPPDIVLLITPSSRHSSLYKLHVFDRKSENHLGMTSITRRELAEIKTSKVFDKYSTIIGNKFIDLKTVAVNTAIIAGLMNNLSGNCCYPKNNSIQTSSCSKYNMLSCDSSKEITELKQCFIEKEESKNGVRLVSLIDRINNTCEPAEKDLHNFFNLAEKYKFKIFIRPELCWKPPSEIDTDYPNNTTRFNVECFMLFDNYVGTITLDSEQLQRQLKAHLCLLQRIQIIDDVCEITPLPKILITGLRTLSKWLGMEMLYDAFGEFVFDLYKQA